MTNYTEPPPAVHQLVIPVNLSALDRWQVQHRMTPLEQFRSAALNIVLTDAFGNAAPRPYLWQPDNTLINHVPIATTSQEI